MLFHRILPTLGRAHRFILGIGGLATSVTSIAVVVAYLTQPPLEEPPAPPHHVAPDRPAVTAGSPQETLAADINRRTASGCRPVVVTTYARNDTPASETTSGQPATYISAAVEITAAGRTERITAWGSGIGPGSVGGAESSLIDNLVAALAEAFPDCF